MHLELKVGGLGEKQNGLEYVKSASEWRGRTEDHHSWKIRRKAEMGAALSETKCHENVRARSLPPKGLLQQNISLITMFASNAKLFMVEGLSCNQFKIISEPLAPACSLGDHCSAFGF